MRHLPRIEASTRIGWVGTGVMGASMCGHILAAGYPVTLFTRSREKAQGLLDQGAVWADTPGGVAGVSDVVFTIVGYPKDVREVYFGADGVLAGLAPGAAAVDMTTTSPSLAVEIAAAAKSMDAWAADAPVSGGDVGARTASLSIMVGCAPELFEALLPLFALIGRNIAHQGKPGAGQHTKMCNQIVIAGSMIGICESLLYAGRAGLDRELMLGAISKGAAGCWGLDNLAPRVLKGDFAPGFMVDHFIKDMGIALDEARKMGLTLPGLALVEGLYRRASKELGLGRSGTQALYLALEKLSS